ncbi:MAG: hypothetical protein ACHQFX_03025 [Chitinophagales bacterium]
MKPFYYLTALVACFIIAIATKAQNRSGVDSTGLPGDNFSLQGALAMFKKASSPEDLEKLLNSEDNHVNNLDLNKDGDIDYIRVIDKSDKEAHAFVLQAVISKKESQDIAVIELEKTGDTTAMLQIIGDEDIYGEQVIVEPGGGGDEEAFIYNENDNSFAGGPNADFENFNPRVVVNVWYWPSVRFVYTPAYRPWVSPWTWHHYPGWWRPWRPLTWHVWHPFHRGYHAHSGIVHTHRVIHAHRVYSPHRVTSVTVTTRHAAAVGRYKVNPGRTKAKTTSGNPGGNKGKRH